VNAVVATSLSLIVCVSVSLAAAGEPRQARPRQPARKIVAHRVTLLRDWVAAVDRHVPGKLDAPAMTLIAWTPDDLRSAWLDVQALIAVVARPTATRFTAQPSGQTVDVSNSTDLATLREMAASVRTRTGGSDLFYKRAAMLHSDIAMRAKGGAVASGSLFVEAKDGAQVGAQNSAVHWEFGRLLLDSVRQPSQDELVRGWYRATMAFRLSVGELDTPHFIRGRELFPRDASILFQLGCLHEWFADPRVQSVTESVRLPRGIRLEVEEEETELRAADESFRRALEIDPGHIEARVRRGRVLGRLQRHELAVEELRAAAARARDPLIAYYAQLFLGAEEEALGRLQQARAAYASAAALYPRAQAPRLALSQLRHRSGDRVAAREALAPALQPGVDDRTDDPWWTYRSAPGRHTDDLLAVVYRQLEAGGTP
jgi:tetratricopeptide (TPR) repeat protein